MPVRNGRRKSTDRRAEKPKLGSADDAATRAASSPTAIAAEALRTGVLPQTSRRRVETIPHEAQTICIGDPDDDTMRNEYGGEETPGGSSPTPDQNGVDEIGRAYGLQEEDAGTLKSAAEVLQKRDR